MSGTAKNKSISFVPIRVVDYLTEINALVAQDVLGGTNILLYIPRIDAMVMFDASIVRGTPTSLSALQAVVYGAYADATILAAAFLLSLEKVEADAVLDVEYARKNLAQ